MNVYLLALLSDERISLPREVVAVHMHPQNRTRTTSEIARQEQKRFRLLQTSQKLRLSYQIGVGPTQQMDAHCMTLTTNADPGPSKLDALSLNRCHIASGFSVGWTRSNDHHRRTRARAPLAKCLARDTHVALVAERPGSPCITWLRHKPPVMRSFARSARIALRYAFEGDVCALANQRCF
ncbi:hypothetical protein IE81DRAFT_107928 [Ceraceosorus guamensis]|uniref:Uncharacterized protein n=1 Tax=Ceraceosorus guamensis TaxID=1522189 RepID=A0A316VZI3_9BASI|nr:hypothetical protein IE81DRAFT_107928 [Ceraceosorus guamensis]PWN42986.1 hypothetical protein IE81DRAFT_107928 [Ceraceosorus guamensis]